MASKKPPIGVAFCRGVATPVTTSRSTHGRILINCELINFHFFFFTFSSLSLSLSLSIPFFFGDFISGRAEMFSDSSPLPDGPKKKNVPHWSAGFDGFFFKHYVTVTPFSELDWYRVFFFLPGFTWFRRGSTFGRHTFFF